MAKTDTISELIDNLRRTIQALNESYKTTENLAGLTNPQLWAINLIATTSQIKVSELAQGMFLHPATVVGIIDRLEAKGLVVRTRSTGDRRVVNLELTPLGRKMVADSPEPAQFRLVKRLEALPEESLLEVASGMKQLVGILGAEERVPQPLFSQEINMTTGQNHSNRPANTTTEE